MAEYVIAFDDSGGDTRFKDGMIAPAPSAEQAACIAGVMIRKDRYPSFRERWQELCAEIAQELGVESVHIHLNQIGIIHLTHTYGVLELGSIHHTGLAFWKYNRRKDKDAFRSFVKAVFATDSLSDFGKLFHYEFRKIVYKWPVIILALTPRNVRST